MASTLTPEAISLGLGDLEIGRYVNGVFQSYRHIGAIRGEATLNISRTVLDFKTGRPLQSVKREVTDEEVTFAFRMSELKVANLKDILGAGTTSSGATPTFLTGNAQAPFGDQTDSYTTAVNADILIFGGNCTLNPLALRFTHRISCEDGSNKRQILEIYQATFGGSMAIPFRESDWNESEVTLTALADFSKSAGNRFFQMIIEQ